MDLVLWTSGYSHDDASKDNVLGVDIAIQFSTLADPVEVPDPRNHETFDRMAIPIRSRRSRTQRGGGCECV